MPAVKLNPAPKLFWRMHKWILRVGGGRAIDKLGKLSALILYTVGRKSGEVRTNALSYVPHSNAYVVVATNAGPDFHPSWWLNLCAKPEAQIEIRGAKTKIKWRVTNGQEADELHSKFVEADSSYAEYKARTKREIPVVVLEPGDK